MRACLLSLAFMLLAVFCAQGQMAKKKLDAYILLPEPSALRTPLSRAPVGAHRTVVSPAHEIEGAPGVKMYTKEEFAHLGISVDTFTERAIAGAEARLKELQPEFIKDETGKTRYAVYRGDSPLIASLLLAPSLGKSLARLFDGELWIVAPDRHSLYLFPAKPAMLAEFADDLQERYKTDPYAASCEVFLLKPGQPLKVVATFGD